MKDKFIPIRGIHYFKDKDKKFAIPNASVESGIWKGIKIIKISPPDRKE